MAAFAPSRNLDMTTRNEIARAVSFDVTQRYNAQRRAASLLNRAAIFAGFVALRKSYCVPE